jgi:hypothetical protein
MKKDDILIIKNSNLNPSWIDLQKDNFIEKLIEQQRYINRIIFLINKERFENKLSWKKDNF